MVAAGRGALHGVLFRDAAAIERLCEVDTLVIDKTGTLTTGKPAFERAVGIADHAPDDVLRLAASLAKASEHPLAGALVAAARDRHLPCTTVAGFRATLGRGMQGDIDGRAIAVGNAAFMTALAIDVSALNAEVEFSRTHGASVMYVASAGKLIGLLTVSDSLKPTTRQALAELKASGLKLVLASGDDINTVRAVVAGLPLDEVHGNVTPAGKLELIRALQTGGQIVAMAGDGSNDAPALAQAEVGIAMGTGTDVAMHSAQITLLQGDLRGIATARALSIATVANMRQNLAFAFCYNTLGIPLAAGLFYPLTGWLLSPMLAAFAMSLSSVSVIGNALRLNRFRAPYRG
jgi:Cu+-exporting ATPase